MGVRSKAGVVRITSGRWHDLVALNDCMWTATCRIVKKGRVRLATTGKVRACTHIRCFVLSC